MIRLRDIQRTFLLGDQQVHALAGINLEVAYGEYISVMGPSGSGKSTLLNVLGLLDKADQGDYWIDDIDTGKLNEEGRAQVRRERVGFVFQSYHLIPRLNARENIELPLVLAGVAPAQRKPLVQQMLQRLGLSDRAEHLPNQLSGGQRQRVAIGRAIIMKPQLLLADEPTGNLDTRSGADVVQVLEELNAEGITLLVVTHDLSLGRRARRQIQMLDGHIQSDQAASSTALSPALPTG